MSLWVLSSVLILILCLAVYAMTRQQAIEAEIQHLVQQNNIEQLYQEYRMNHRTLNLYVLGGILLTGGFALTFFGAGSLTPSTWTLEQSVYALVGLVATVSITLGQRSLYRNIKQNVSALLVTLLVLAFVIFSEVATTSEREASLVRDRSLNSPTLQALLDHVATPNQNTTLSRDNQYYRRQITQTQIAWRDCRDDACRTTQEQALLNLQASLEQNKQDQLTLMQAQRADKLAFAEQAKQLEYNEQHHSAVIRWLQAHAATTFTAAMMFASLIFVVAFESGFHFTGTKEGIYLEAIARLGYNVRQKERLPRAVTRQNTAALPTYEQEKGVPVQSAQVTQAKEDDLLRHDRHVLHQAAKQAKTGATVCCPFCAKDFVKRRHNQAFCQTTCKDHFWNEMKPERLGKARGVQHS